MNYNEINYERNKWFKWGYNLYSVNIKIISTKIKENLRGISNKSYAHQTSDGSGKENYAERYVFESE